MFCHSKHPAVEEETIIQEKIIMHRYVFKQLPDTIAITYLNN